MFLEGNTQIFKCLKGWHLDTATGCFYLSLTTESVRPFLLVVKDFTLFDIFHLTVLSSGNAHYQFQ